MTIQKVCVYCASSKQAHPLYYQIAAELGILLARNGIEIVYGGGAVGSMGALADGAISANGTVTGIIPRFMAELEWAHPSISNLVIVETLHERKQRMIEKADAAIALPGGTGTLEELIEAITWKRLGIYFNPIILVNTRRYFDPLIELLQRCISEKFMDPRHERMWSVVDTPDQVLTAIASASTWDENARSFAAL
ncbi:MAG: TIGR00730 family Rossman fold protein [Candidatus Zhuqueibacterota bacterium]